MDVAAYLRRIDYHSSVMPNADTLRALHVAHLQTVPFENLDIHLHRPIDLDPARMYKKIVVDRRGGFCYELNGLFALLLQALGWHVTYLSASDAYADGSYGPLFDHLALQVQAPEDRQAQTATSWLADVGWGDTFCTPLRLDSLDVQLEGARAYRLERDAASYILWQRHASGEWERNYRFTLEPRQFDDFAAMCSYHQTSPQSLFTRNRLCTRATSTGRVTLDDTRLITTINGQREEHAVSSEDAFWQLASQHFGIEPTK